MGGWYRHIGNTGPIVSSRVPLGKGECKVTSVAKILAFIVAVAAIAFAAGVFVFLSNATNYSDQLKTEKEAHIFCSQCKIYTPVSRLKVIKGKLVCDSCRKGENNYLM